MSLERNDSQMEKATKEHEQKSDTQTPAKERTVKLNRLLNLLEPVPARNIQTPVEKSDEINAIATLAHIMSIEKSRVRSNQLIDKKLVYEKMQADLSGRALFSDNLESFFDDCTATIGEALSFDTVSFWKYNEKPGNLQLTSYWSAKRRPAQPIESYKFPAENYPKTISKLKRSQIVSYSEGDDLADGIEIMKLSTAKSILLLPIFVYKELYGFLEFEAHNRLTQRKNAEVDGLKSTAKIIARIIHKKHIEIDLLNRYKLLKKSLRQQAKEIVRINKNLKEEIRERKAAVCALRQREKELSQKNAELENLNTALKIVFRRRDNDLNEIEDKMLHNIKQMVEPAISELKKCSLDSKQQKCLMNLETNLDEITSPMVLRLSSQKYQLTPTEIRIANLVKHGRRTKEIAQSLKVAPKTIDTHRLNIRKKLGIASNGKNLRTFLLDL